MSLPPKRSSVNRAIDTALFDTRTGRRIAAHISLTRGEPCGTVHAHDKFPSRGLIGNSGSMPGLPPQL
jgi:hypothetical protein